MEWFRLNSLKTNPGKFQFMILGDKNFYENILKINLTYVQSSDAAILIGVIIDKSLTFQKHIDNFVWKVQYKFYVLRRIRKFLTVEKHP